MKEKKAIVIGILVVIVLVAGFGILKWKSAKKAVQQQAQSQQQIKDNQQGNNLQPQQIPEDQLVWYEIPELGIKFKVTPDAREDLKYIVKNSQDKYAATRTMSAILYLRSVSDFFGGKACDFSNDNIRCAEFIIALHQQGYCENAKKNEVPEVCGVVIKNNNKELEIIRNQQAPLFISKEEGMRYASTVKDRNLGFFQHYGDMELLKKTYYPFGNIEFAK